MANTASSIRSRRKKEEVEKFLCHYCGEKKKKEDFYSSSDPMVVTGITCMCKDCAKKIARNYNPKTESYGDCTRQSIQDALERLDKPFLERVWINSVNELNSGKCKMTDLFSVYMRQISNQSYKMLRWRDGDVFTSFRNDENKGEQTAESSEVERNQQIREEYHKNRDDVIRLIGYDPFEKEAEKDKPLLYSQLIGYLDMSGDSNDDMMKVSSAISIVRGFLQIEKIDNMIADIMKDPIKAANNVGTMKSLQEMKQKVNSTVTN